MLLLVSTLPPLGLAAIPLRQGAAGVALLAGALFVGFGLWRVWQHGRSGVEEPAGMAASDDARGRSAQSVLLLLALVVVVGGALRLDGLAAKTLTHTEALLPNIAWPSEVSFPPARFSFYDTFWWHFHSEGHPQGYAFLMWAWTKVFGTGLIALRLPSVLFGVGCLLLMFGIGRLSYSDRVGLVGAALLALNGLHLYWSQYARMYAMGCFLALFSTYLLLRAARHTEGRHRWDAAYVLVSWLAAYTQTFFWPILATQALWTVFQRDTALRRRLFVLQAVVVMLGASSLAHTAYLGDDVSLPGPSWVFLGHFLSFGFLFEPDLFSQPARFAPPLLAVGALVLAVACGAVGLGVRPAVWIRARPAPLRTWTALPVALGSALIIAAFALLAHRRNALVAAVGLVPLGALLLPSLGERLHTAWTRASSGRRDLNRLALPAFLAVVPATIVFGLSFWTSLLAPRAFLLFVPFLLLVAAAGAVRLARSRWVGWPLGVALVLIHGASVLHFRAYPSEQIDYATLGREVNARMQEGDFVFLLPDLWVYTPFFYYLDGEAPRYIAQDYAAALAERPSARVWVLYFDSVQWGPYGTTNSEIERALQPLTLQDEVTSRRGRARLFVAERPAP